MTSITKAAWACSQILLTFPNAISKTGFIAGTALAIGSAILALWTMCTTPSLAFLHRPTATFFQLVYCLLSWRGGRLRMTYHSSILLMICWPRTDSWLVALIRFAGGAVS